jgi:hypothetical protein
MVWKGGAAPVVMLMLRCRVTGFAQQYVPTLERNSRSNGPRHRRMSDRTTAACCSRAGVED